MRQIKESIKAPRAGNSPETSEFPAQMASNAENGSIWWRHHENAVGIIAYHRQPELGNGLMMESVICLELVSKRTHDGTT